MKCRNMIALLLALSLLLALALPAVAAADPLTFSDVAEDSWYYDAVQWAAENTITAGYPDGRFHPDRGCTVREALVLLWRAAGSKPSLVLHGGASEFELALDWYQRLTGEEEIWQWLDRDASRLGFLGMIYRTLGGLALSGTENSFTDLSETLDSQYPDYQEVVDWAVSTGITNGTPQGTFEPLATLTRAQAVSFLYRLLTSPTRYTLEKRQTSFYVGSLEDVVEQELWFVDGKLDIPYLSLEGMKGLLELIYGAAGDPNYQLEIDTEADKAWLIRENTFYILLEFSKDTIYCLDIDAFRNTSMATSLLDVVALSGSEPLRQYFHFEDAGSERYGRDITLDLGAYGLDLVYQDGGYYIPLQTVNDVFLSFLGVNVLFNGEALFFGVSGAADADGNLSPLDELYYSAPRGVLSPQLTRFTYQELCFLLDYFYGLQEQHDIRSFHELFQMTGLIELLQSGDTAKMDDAIKKLVFYYMDDLHSNFSTSSHWLTQTEDPPSEVTRGVYWQRMLADVADGTAARMAAYPDGIPLYEEIGDTAYITFDGFTYQGVDYYETPPDENAPDTIGQMAYCFSQITRKDSPIKNVVLDLSLNLGGAAPSAAYVAAMFLGNASLSLKETLTGALTTQNFQADLNLDHQFDEQDYLLGRYNLFCLTSRVSFSCGNLVPSILKESGAVTMLGKPSGGGACTVLNTSTAYGTQFKISGPLCLSYLRNGSFYDIDQGVTPHYRLSDYSAYYDREALTDYIHILH